MSGPSKNSTTYSAADLQRYWSGEMSAREMHDLEMAALEDPFLADALEGFEKQETSARGPAQKGDQVLSGHLDDLHARLDSRVSASEKVAPAPEISPAPASKLFSLRAPWLRIAAAAILLFGLGAGAWYGLLNKSKERTLADEISRPVAKSAHLANADSVKIALATADSAKIAPADTTKTILSDGEGIVAKAEAPQKRTKISTNLRAPAASQVPAASPVLSYRTSPAADSGTVTAFQRDNGALAGLSIKKDTIIYNKDTTAYNSEIEIRGLARKAFSPDLSKSRLAEVHPLVFSGKVLDVHDNPLPGATLFLADPTGNQRIGTVTDLNGYFKMKVYPKDSVLKVTVGMTGYQPASLAFNTLNTESFTGNLIHLTQQPNALDEVVVSGYGSKRKETRARASSPDVGKIDSLWINARPVMGKQAYLDYLAAGKKNIGVDTSVRGAVVISFDVTKKGELNSFKVEQSLTPAHDAGVIHLISEGPPWKKVSKGASIRTAVRVVF